MSGNSYTTYAMASGCAKGYYVDMIEVPIDRWRASKKDGWIDLIRKWNYRFGHIKKIPRATATPGSAFLPPRDRKGFDRDRKSQRNKPVLVTPHIVWDDVPQRLPYRFSEDRQTVFVEETFAEMVRQARKPSMK